MKMTTQELTGIIAREIAEARGYDADELASARREALKYYFGRPRGDEIEGRSQIQSLDVADQVNSIMAQLAPMMKSTLVDFMPTSEQDEDQAQLESDMVMYLADQSNAYQQFSSAAFDSLLQSNGWIKVYTRVDTQEWQTKHDNLDDIALAEVLRPRDTNEVVTIASERPGEGNLSSVTLDHVIEEKRLIVEAVPPEYMMFTAGHLSQDVSNMRFLAEKKLISRSDMLAMGYKQSDIDQLGTVDYETYEAATERQFSYDDKRSGEERSTEVIDVYEVYAHVDFDGDGIAELRRIIIGGYDGQLILENEPAKFTPYCTGCALPMPHRLTGTSQYDMLKTIQDAKTHTLRQWLDNQNVANNSRVGAVEGECNMGDLTSSKPGGIVRMRSEGAIIPIPFNDAGPSCQQALMYLDTVRTERGGAALEMQTGPAQNAMAGAGAVAAEYGHKEKMSAFYCRNIVESIVKGTFLLIHQTMRNEFDENLTAKLHGKWKETRPADWPRRRNVRVLAGMSGAERGQKAQSLLQNLGHQMTAMQSGLDGVMVNPDKIHATLADWLRAVDLQDVESYYIDPSSEEAAAASKEKAEAAQAQAQKQSDLEKRLIDQEQQLSKYKHDTELEYKRWSDELDAAVEQMKLLGGALADVEQFNMAQAIADKGGEADAA